MRCVLDCQICIPNPMQSVFRADCVWLVWVWSRYCFLRGGWDYTNQHKQIKKERNKKMFSPAHWPSSLSPQRAGGRGPSRKILQKLSPRRVIETISLVFPEGSWGSWVLQGCFWSSGEDGTEMLLRRIFLQEDLVHASWAAVPAEAGRRSEPPFLAIVRKANNKCCSDRAIDRATERSSPRAIDRAIERSSDRPSDRSTERPSDRATEASQKMANLLFYFVSIFFPFFIFFIRFIFFYD